MRYVLDAARNIGKYIKEDCIVVDKSTVPVGVADEVKSTIEAELKARHLSLMVDVVSNPEFLREGAAIQDFMNPDRVIVGVNSEHAKMIMQELYMPILRHPEKLYSMNVKDAEMTKYAANAMLAAKISLMNEIAVLCQEKGVDVENVRLGMGSDTRIGNLFINPGCGYGGSCFPKDVKALIKMAEESGVDPFVLRAVEERNFHQKQLLPKKIIELLGSDLSGITIGVWGLSFKPGTDDMREAPSLILLDHLIAHHAHVRAYDPVAMVAAKKILPEAWFLSGQLELVDEQYAACESVDALVLVTEWKSFCYPDIEMMKKKMRRLLVLDGRNQYDPHFMESAGFEYYGIGRSSKKILSNKKLKLEEIA
jgi:UDPglucose 6-dehydrogenase